MKLMRKYNLQRSWRVSPRLMEEETTIKGEGEVEMVGGDEDTTCGDSGGGEDGGGNDTTNRGDVTCGISCSN
ncbi:hypothetical protein Bca4012_065972 [Brassica carinata]|uniref:Uncharacterized protein n=1 Tax=Brassica carinata TaxID=52824 RepID=A0A8X7VPS3_BRACI|nr:hypothetical protein Bca52824_018291 [Brassica carinata]